MKQVKTFITCVDESNDDLINEFMKNHKIINIRNQIMQGFTYTSKTIYETNIYETFKPSIITTIIYEVEK